MATTVITVPLKGTADAAARFKNNWLARNPTPPLHSDDSSGSSGNGGESGLDDSLTSLNWLQNLRIMRIQQPTPPSSPSPTPLASAWQRLNTTITIQHNKGSGNGNNSGGRLKGTTQEEAKAFSRIGTGHQSASAAAAATTGVDQVDYKTNQYVKPPYSYATLIWMAMKASKKSKITLSAIYKWITENFKYYQTADPSWQNSIRHNLSLNKCFMKVPRRKDEPGKGGFWQIDPAHADLLENGIFKKRRNSSNRDYYAENIKRIKVEPVDEEYDYQERQHSRKQIAPKRKVPDLELPKSRPQQLNSLGSGDLSDSDENLPSALLKGDFGWSSIFPAEIEVDGIKVKTEDILDEVDPAQCSSPGLHLSPPPSNEPVGEAEEECNFLDLSINGVHIPRPLWFDEHLQGLDFSTEETEMLLNDIDLPPSPVSSINDLQSHPWAEAGGPVALDVDDLLSVPGEDMPWDLSLHTP
jgi:forkhead box protein J1